MPEALTTLLLYAQSLGIVPMAVPSSAKPVQRVALADVVDRQERAWVAVDKAELAIAFDAKGEPKLKVRPARCAATFDSADVIVQCGSGSARLPATALLEAAYRKAWAIDFDGLRYAVLYEDGANGVSSQSLLRRDGDGRYWVAYADPAALRRGIDWFVSVDGTMYGRRLEGEDLAFYSERGALKGPPAERSIEIR